MGVPSARRRGTARWARVRLARRHEFAPDTPVAGSLSPSSSRRTLRQSRLSTRRQMCGKYGWLLFQATSSPSSRRPGGRPRSSGSTSVMFQPRRLRTRRPSSVETSARKPSHFSSKDHPEPEGKGPGARQHRVGKPQSLGKLARGRGVAPLLFALRLVVPLLPRSVPASPLFRRRMIIEGVRALFPTPALRRRHFSHDEFP